EPHRAEIERVALAAESARTFQYHADGIQGLLRHWQPLPQLPELRPGPSQSQRTQWPVTRSDKPPRLFGPRRRHISLVYRIPEALCSDRSVSLSPDFRDNLLGLRTCKPLHAVQKR